MSAQSTPLQVIIFKIYMYEVNVTTVSIRLSMFRNFQYKARFKHVMLEQDIIMCVELRSGPLRLSVKSVHNFIYANL